MITDRLPILELRHVESEGPGAYTSVLEEYAPLVTVRLWQSQPLPDLGGFSAIVVMGGPMGANDGPTVPWIDDEIAYLRGAVAAGIPVWGVCLGSQLLAAALGAPVRKGEVPEVGVHELEMSDAGASDPVWGDAPAVFSALQWHSDTFDLPKGAVLLASSRDYPHQLFRYDKSYAIQFHLEADGDMARRWLQIAEYVSALEHALGAGAAQGFLAGVVAAEPDTIKLAREAIRRWLDVVFPAESAGP